MIFLVTGSGGATGLWLRRTLLRSYRDGAVGLVLPVEIYHLCHCMIPWKNTKMAERNLDKRNTRKNKTKEAIDENEELRRIVYIRLIR